MSEISLIEKLKRTNRLYAVISQVNSMMLHIKDRNMIFAEVCRIAVDEGQFLMSWIGLLDDETQEISPVQWAGKEEGYLKSIPKISAIDIKEGRGPTGKAFRDKKSWATHSFANDPELSPWKKEGLKRGYGSSVAIPIILNESAIGTFNIYAADENFFNEIEIQLLEAVTKNIAFALETIANITEKKKIETDLLIANKERAEELLLNSAKMSALGEMASGIAHEINNPLSIIVMQATQLLRKHNIGELSEEEFESGLVKISSTAQRIGKVVKGLRTISRNSDNDPKREIKIHAVLEDTIQLCQERFNTHQIKFQEDISSLGEIQVLGRSSQIMQVLLNLLNNSFDAVMPLEDKWVEIKACIQGPCVCIKVIDSGTGIPGNLLSKIMQPFFTTKEPGKGTGLGLSISKSIIEEHNGALYYQKNNENTCFVIELPIQDLLTK